MIFCVHAAGGPALSCLLPLSALLQGLSRADQAEVEVNKVAVYLNLAAVYLEMQVGTERGGGCRWTAGMCFVSERLPNKLSRCKDLAGPAAATLQRSGHPIMLQSVSVMHPPCPCDLVAAGARQRGLLLLQGAGHRPPQLQGPPAPRQGAHRAARLRGGGR